MLAQRVTERKHPARGRAHRRAATRNAVMREPAEDSASTAPIAFPATVNIVLVLTAIGTVYFGLFPNQVLRLLLEKTLIGGLNH